MLNVVKTLYMGVWYMYYCLEQLIAVVEGKKIGKKVMDNDLF